MDVFVAISIATKRVENVSLLPGIVEGTQAAHVKQEKNFWQRKREREARTFVLAASKLSETDQKSRQLWPIC